MHRLYTRHHDGHVRQRHLARIIEVTDSWIVPFVVQLIGSLKDAAATYSDAVDE